MQIRLINFNTTDDGDISETSHVIKDITKINLMNGWLMAIQRGYLVHSIVGDPIEKYQYDGVFYDALIVEESDEKE